MEEVLVNISDITVSLSVITVLLEVKKLVQSYRSPCAPDEGVSVEYSSILMLY